ncbi:MAG: DUF4153 domain-containing protein [Pseudomonadota bacterium]
MQKILRSIVGLSLQFLETLSRYPATCLTAALAVVQSIFMVENKIDMNESSLIFTVLLGLPLLFAAESTIAIKKWARGHKALVTYLVAFILLGLHFLYVDGDRSQNFIIRYFQVSLIVHLTVSFLPFCNLKKESDFWTFNSLLIQRFLEAMIYAVVLYIGLALALVSIDKLLGVEIYDNLYLYIWFFCALFFHPVLFLAKLPKDFSNEMAKMSYPKGLQYFVQYLLIPLVSLFTAILYAYMFKILFSREWPEGYLGWLVSIISVLGVLNLLLLDPLQKTIEWIKGYAKVFYYLMFPLLIMLFVAVYKRIEAYGITEKRYALISFGMLLVAIMAYFLFSRSKNIKVVPMALSGLLAVTLFGPWSAYTVSRKSQLAQAEALLEKNGLLINGRAVQGGDHNVSFKDAQRLTNILNYLVKNHDLKYLQPWFPKEVLDSVWGYSSMGNGYRGRFNKNSEKLMKHMGLEYTSRYSTDYASFFNFSYPGKVDVIPIAGGYTHLIEFQSYSSGREVSRVISGAKYRIVFELVGEKALRVGADKDLRTVDLMGLVKKGLEIPKDQRSQMDPKDFEFLVDGKCDCKVVIRQINGSTTPEEGIRITTLQLALLLRDKKK